MKKKQLALLGSTGSIGKSTLEVVRHLKENIQVTALAARENIDLLEAQAKEFRPEIIAVYDKQQALRLQKRIPHISVVGGMEGLEEVASHPSNDFVVSAIVGSVGIAPTLKAIEAGKSIGLANKEILITAGELVMAQVKEKGVHLIPLDSEHSAIFQCLKGESEESVQRVLLTASGGPFWHLKQEELEKATLEMALKHPNWNMGKKITIDCSTLMNKGLEVIEAHHLFGLPLQKIEVVIHPQSLIHSFVEYIDGSLLAQIAEPKMIVPIQYALTYPFREKGILPPFDFTKYEKMEFFPPNYQKFPCLSLAYEAAKQGGTMPCFMNAVNEVLVERFIQGKLRWIEIGKKLEKLMGLHQVEKRPLLETLFAVDIDARQRALGI
ncbi:MAG: 1-deoxy-D-xylulose-5-phosphate reductoisomerase [Simkania negevensis]|nr:1-deoxy-D-xylulose-5-phosphate reductoisomerase [Simkania negevensis]